MKLEELKDLLHKEGCSCVIENSSGVTFCRQRGVADLFYLLQTHPQKLVDARIADKVVGKGASALMVLGKIKEVYADVISNSALKLLRENGVEVTYSRCVPYIINRKGDGVCPVETLCKGCATAEECLPLIAEFINSKNK